MKKSMFAIVVCVGCLLAGLNVIGADGETGPAGRAPAVTERQYVQLAQLLSACKGADGVVDVDKAIKVATTALREAVADGETYDEKLVILAKLTTALMGAMADWDFDSRLRVIHAMIQEVMSFAKQGSDDYAAERIGFARQIIAALAVSSVDSAALMAEVESLPEDLRATAAEAVAHPTVVLGGTLAWEISDLYKAVRGELGAPADEEKPAPVDLVTVSTTTSTATTTSTTTTTIAGSGIVEFVEPGALPVVPTVPTTAPSPTPVGLR